MAEWAVEEREESKRLGDCCTERARKHGLLKWAAALCDIKVVDSERKR
jgi:hypothetical protein